MVLTSSTSHTDKNSRVLSNSRDKDTSAPKSKVTTLGSSLKLGTKQTSITTDKSTKATHQGDDPPGSEFDITRVVVPLSEPDYFADMEPAVSFKAKDSKVVPVHSHSEKLSSKLAMVEDTSQV